MPTKEIILSQVKELVKSKGFIYALSLIISEDFHVSIEHLHQINYRDRLSSKEISLLLGFLIQDKIDFSFPDKPEVFISLKKETYRLMKELHDSFMIPFFDRLKEDIENPKNISDYRTALKEFFGNGESMTEPIFYSGTGLYDFQYLEFLEQKYRKDKEWLWINRRFDAQNAIRIVERIKDILHEKSKKIEYRAIKETLPDIVDKLKKKKSKKISEEEINLFTEPLVFFQYAKLFSENIQFEKCTNDDDIRKEGWKSFYQGIVDLFVIRKSDFDEELDFDTFLNNFSIKPMSDENAQFGTIGNYNKVNSNPIIDLGDGRYYIPSSFFISEAVFESPFYWMFNDKKYKDQAGKNRGDFGEEISFNFLKNVFGAKRTYKSVKIQSLEALNSTKRRKDDTDIDVLCILGSKALCVQVKSKKLTELAKTGDDKALNKDFQGAVQDAYDQGIVSRREILNKRAKFIDQAGNELKLSEGINEVYILCITTENYPSLAHQAHILLDKKNDEPYPLVITIFDLELICHYLHDPYDFLYYVRQRIDLMDHFKATEEITYLGYHLVEKLWRFDEASHVTLCTDLGQLIDRNFFPYKAGIQTTSSEDKIGNRWRNDRFDQLCNELKTLKQPKITDIIFHLYDWCGKAREDLVNFIVITRRKTIIEDRNSNFSMPPEEDISLRVGITYFAANSDDRNYLKDKLLFLSDIRKYKDKGDIWIGLGSLKNSPNMIDLVVYSDGKWEYDPYLEKESQILNNSKKTFIGLDNKIGRNDKCPCGSGKKHKFCCGR